MTASTTKLVSSASPRNAGETHSLMIHTAWLVSWCVNSIALLAAGFFFVGVNESLSAIALSLAPVTVMAATAVLITAAALRQPTLAAASLGALICSMLMATSAYGALNNEPWPSERAAELSSDSVSDLAHMDDIDDCEGSSKRASAGGFACRY